MSSNETHEYLRGILLGLPGVRLGIRFGGEAFFVGKRFFCHFHRGGTLLLETFVWDKVNEGLYAGFQELFPIHSTGPTAGSGSESLLKLTLRKRGS